MISLLLCLKVYYLFKVEPVVQKGHEGLVHHILLYECPDSFPTSFLNHSGFCYNETTPREIMECAGQSTVAAWAIGGGVRFDIILSNKLPTFPCNDIHAASRRCLSL